MSPDATSEDAAADSGVAGEGNSEEALTGELGRRLAERQRPLRTRRSSLAGVDTAHRPGTLGRRSRSFSMNSGLSLSTRRALGLAVPDQAVAGLPVAPPAEWDDSWFPAEIPRTGNAVLDRIIAAQSSGRNAQPPPAQRGLRSATSRRHTPGGRDTAPGAVAHRYRSAAAPLTNSFDVQRAVSGAGADTRPRASRGGPGAPGSPPGRSSGRAARGRLGRPDPWREHRSAHQDRSARLQGSDRLQRLGLAPERGNPAVGSRSEAAASATSFGIGFDPRFGSPFDRPLSGQPLRDQLVPGPPAGNDRVAQVAQIAMANGVTPDPAPSPWLPRFASESAPRRSSSPTAGAGPALGSLPAPWSNQAAPSAAPWSNQAAPSSVRGAPWVGPGSSSSSVWGWHLQRTGTVLPRTGTSLPPAIGAPATQLTRSQAPRSGSGSGGASSSPVAARMALRRAASVGLSQPQLDVAGAPGPLGRSVMADPGSSLAAAALAPPLFMAAPNADPVLERGARRPEPSMASLLRLSPPTLTLSTPPGGAAVTTSTHRQDRTPLPAGQGAMGMRLPTAGSGRADGARQLNSPANMDRPARTSGLVGPVELSSLAPPAVSLPAQITAERSPRSAGSVTGSHLSRTGAPNRGLGSLAASTSTSGAMGNPGAVGMAGPTSAGRPSASVPGSTLEVPGVNRPIRGARPLAELGLVGPGSAYVGLVPGSFGNTPTRATGVRPSTASPVGTGAGRQHRAPRLTHPDAAGGSSRPSHEVGPHAMAERFQATLAEHGAPALTRLPQRFAPMARAILPRPDRVRISAGGASRKALSSVGKVAATQGEVVHLAEPLDSSRSSIAVLAHELTHVAHASPLVRFFDDDRKSDEESVAREVGEIMARAPVGSPPASPPPSPPVAPSPQVAAASDHMAQAGSLARSGSSVGQFHTSDDEKVGSPADDRFGPGAGTATMGSNPITDEVVNAGIDVNRILDALESRIIRELERRGRRWPRPI